MKARKWIVTGVTAGLLAGGAAGFMVTVPGGAGAATSTTVQVAGDGTEANGETIVMPQHHGQPHRSPEERAAKFGEVLQTLVDDGTLTSAQRDAIVAALTTRPETPPTGERPDPSTIMTTRLQGLVDEGTITVAQRDTVIATLQAARPASGEHEGHQDRQGRRAERRQASLETAASVIGVTADELKAALQSGQSIAQVATANGVDPQTVIDALVAEATTDLTQRITDMVNGVRPADAPADPAN